MRENMVLTGIHEKEGEDPEDVVKEHSTRSSEFIYTETGLKW
jgi:hypothetical protein